MTAKLKTVVAGALYGIVAGGCAALAVMRLVPSVGHPVTLGDLPADFGWAIFFAGPVGPLVGAGAGAFLSWRARTVRSFRKLVVETSALAAAGAGMLTQMVIPIAWELPRTTITIIAAVGAAALAALGAWMLKPLYWRKPVP